MNDAELVHAFLDRLADGEIAEWLTLLDEDVVAETPFSPDGTARRFDGQEAVRHRFGDARQRMQSLTFLDRTLHHTVDGPVVVTCRSEGIRGDGKRYKNSYCWLFTIRDGQISAWVEYFDPQEVLRVAGT